MDIIKEINKISQSGLSTEDKQKNINVSEVFHLWNHLLQRYNVLHLTNILEQHARDEDLKLVLDAGRKTLGNQIIKLEKEMLNYGIPLPLRPPKQTKTTSSVEAITDRFIFRRILRGIQSFLPTHMMAFIHSTSSKIRELFMSFMIEEMKLYDKFLEYGKIKGYEVSPPRYKM